MRKNEEIDPLESQQSDRDEAAEAFRKLVAEMARELAEEEERKLAEAEAKRAKFLRIAGKWQSVLAKHNKVNEFQARERLKRRLHEIEIRRINDILGAMSLEEGEHFETGKPQSYCIGEGQPRLL